VNEMADRIGGAQRRLQATQAPVPDRLLSADEAAEMLNVSAWQIRDWAKKRVIPALKLGKFWRFRRSALEQWMEAQERPAR
jgi:excisionase family DNA binding protein